MEINPVKGTHDIISEEAYEYDFIETRCAEIAYLFNYKEIRTPVLEQTNLFVRSVGESTDIVNKEMYTFDDKGGRSLSLRPEFTAGIMRSIVSNKLYVEATLPLKLFYKGPCFRYERPQLGRYRQFHQFGVEAVGNPNPRLDAETIAMAHIMLQSLGFNKVTLKINTLGDDETRNRYKNALVKYFSSKIDLMCEDCKRRLQQNPLRILDCKVPEDIEIIKKAPKLSDFITDEAKETFNKILNVLKLYNIEYEIDETLVRGLDYYTGVVFEFHIHSESGDVGAVGGGGHYKNLLKEIGGPDYEGVGFSFGEERLHFVWKSVVKPFGLMDNLDFYILPMSEKVLDEATITSDVVRSLGLKCEIALEPKSFKSMLKTAIKENAKFAIIIGEDEVERKIVTVKNLKTQVQTTVNIDGIESVLTDLIIEYKKDLLNIQEEEYEKN